MRRGIGIGALLVVLGIGIALPTVHAAALPPKGIEGPDIRATVEPKGVEGPDVRFRNRIAPKGTEGPDVRDTPPPLGIEGPSGR